MSEYSLPIAALAAFAALSLKLVQLWRDPHNPALRAICGVLGALGVSVLVGWSPCYLAIDEFTGIANLARYVMHGSALAAAASIQTLFLYLGDPDKAPRRSQWRWAALLCVLVIMAVSFSRAGFSVEAPDDFADRYADSPQLAEYMLAYLGYVGLAMIDVFRMSVRYSRKLPKSLLRFGIRLLVVGSVVGLGYVIHKLAFVVAGRLKLELPWAEGQVSKLLILSGIAFVAGGLVIPSVGSYVVDVRHWPHRYQLYRDLYPLWEAIYSVNKAVNLHPPRRRPTIRLMNHALYRRVIEIRDGIRELSPYIDPAITQTAAQAAADIGIAPQEARAIGDAAGIAAMLDYVRATPPAARTPMNSESMDSAAGAAAEDHQADARWEADARWLASVSCAYVKSPIVAEHRGDQRSTKS